MAIHVVLQCSCMEVLTTPTQAWSSIHDTTSVYMLVLAVQLNDTQHYYWLVLTQPATLCLATDIRWLAPCLPCINILSISKAVL